MKSTHNEKWIVIKWHQLLMQIKLNLLIFFSLIYLFNSTRITGQEIDLIDNSYWGDIAWSSNNQLAISSSRGMWIYESNTEYVSLVDTCLEKSNSPAFSHDELLLAYITGERSPFEVKVYDLSTQQQQFSYHLEGDYPFRTQFSPMGEFLVLIAIKPDWVNPTTTVPLIDIAQKIEVSQLNFQIPNGEHIEWAEFSRVLWMLGRDAGAAVHYVNAVDTVTGEIIFRFPAFGNFYESLNDGNVFSFGAAQLVDNFAIFFTPIDPYSSPGFVIFDLKSNLEDLNRISNFQLGADFDDINRGLVIPYSQLSDLFTLSRQTRSLALVERDTLDQFRLLNIDTQETTSSVRADARITELQFNPDGSVLAVRTASDREDEVRIELWDVVSLERITVLEVSKWQAQYC